MVDNGMVPVLECIDEVKVMETTILKLCLRTIGMLDFLRELRCRGHQKLRFGVRKALSKEVEHHDSFRCTTLGMCHIITVRLLVSYWYYEHNPNGFQNSVKNTRARQTFQKILP